MWQLLIVYTIGLYSHKCFPYFTNMQTEKDLRKWHICSSIRILMFLTSVLFFLISNNFIFLIFIEI